MNILLTGAAGFIGSHIADALAHDPRVDRLTLLDNLSTGSIDNIRGLLDLPRVHFVEGDIRDYAVCLDACRQADRICHQAALGSVPRSIEHPLNTHRHNADGTLHLLEAARQCGIKRFVYASSSSVYGDNPELPKREDRIGTPLSPYAVTKRANELYAQVFGRHYGMEPIGLRYFNIFGPRQSPQGPYAAVIPLFMKALIEGRAPRINGDGSISRDFTYVTNAVQANLRALFTERAEACKQIYNIACGSAISLNELFAMLREIAHSDLEPEHGPERPGDIAHSLADISLARRFLDYAPAVGVREGLQTTFAWFAARHTPTSA
ncbi:MAG: SDR family oxidoreductase [Saprospiraceae bacterium]